MIGFEEEIKDFLKANGVESMEGRALFPLPMNAISRNEAQWQAEVLKTRLEVAANAGQTCPIIIPEDRWRRQRQMMEARILAHLEIFFPIYARNCEVRRIEKAEAAAFLEANHSYGDAACRYRYGLFLKRHTGEKSLNPSSEHSRSDFPAGTLVAVAEFSNARKWLKGEKTIRSYEWTRYASLPGVRIIGGMGKMLRHFIKEVQPDDIMSYADLEWSEGAVYEQLGFTLEGHKEPVMFKVNMQDWSRQPLKAQSTYKDNREAVFVGETSVFDDVAFIDATGKYSYYQNLGSNKYRLKLTDYE